MDFSYFGPSLLNFIVLGAEKVLGELSGCAQRFLFAILVFFEKSNVEIFYFGLLV